MCLAPPGLAVTAVVVMGFLEAGMPVLVACLVVSDGGPWGCMWSKENREKLRVIGM